MSKDIVREDGIICDADGDPYRCPEEKESRSVLCKPHRCDLDEGHKGKHVCNCGVSWRTRS